MDNESLFWDFRIKKTIRIVMTLEAISMTICHLFYNHASEISSVRGRVIEHMKEKMMLKLIGSVSLLIFSSVAFSQPGTNPPNDVRESFHRDYPKSQGGEWVNQGKGFEVKFNDRDNDNGESVAYYRSDGVRIDTHTQYDNRDIPQQVTEHMRGNYPGSDGYRVVHIDRHSAPDMYEVHYTHKKYRHKIYVDEYGKEKNYYDYHY